MKRSPLKRKSRLSPISKRRKEELKEYSRLRKEFLGAHPVCQVWLKENGWEQETFIGESSLFWSMDRCSMRLAFELIEQGADRATEVHHKARRGKNYLNTDTWLAVSSRNHKRIEGQSTYDNKPYGMKWARAQGFLA